MEKVIQRGTDYLGQELNLDQKDLAMVNFAMRVMWSSVIGYLVIATIAWGLGVLPVTLAAAITASMLRVTSGGAHANSLENCTIVGTVVFVALGLLTTHTFDYIVDYVIAINLVVAVIALILVYFFAPADTAAKPLRCPNHRHRLRLGSLATVLVWAVACQVWSLWFADQLSLIYSSTLGMFWQSLCITPFGYSLAKRFDLVLDVLKGAWPKKGAK